jgi:lipopolysaccharide/colanic/teichoic acid biosynthesis glycosyltransferase
MAVDEVILALPTQEPMNPEIYEAVLDCRELGIHMTQMTTVYERLTGRVPVAYASWDVEMVAGTQDSAFQRFYDAAKRMTDMVAGLAGLLLIALLSLPICLANALTSPGQLLYEQRRVGKGGRPFPILKFRSMVPQAETGGEARWAKTDDERITPIGKWLRRLHLDELPQAINLLRGEMSLVGPRPERPEFVELLAPEIPYYRVRHSIRPGITGWAQIHQGYGGSVEDSRVKLEYDLYYIKRSSMWLDLVIMLRTVTKVLGLKGR